MPGNLASSGSTGATPIDHSLPQPNFVEREYIPMHTLRQEVFIKRTSWTLNFA